MAQVRRISRNKHQVRTEETQAKILDAAEEVFSEQGFEMTQLEEVAARAGYTRGAIYAHYAGKEDLFLALVEQRVLSKFAAIRQLIEAEPEVAKRPAMLKHWIAIQAGDRAWGTLILEFKLYALRRPQSREKLQNMYEQMSKGSGNDFIELLFGSTIDKASRAAAERRLSIIGSVLSAVNLESQFRPKPFTKPQLQQIFGELFDALVRT
jgi:AcrR family transcriptional regulator